MPFSLTVANHLERKPRIVFWGTPAFAVPALEALVTQGWHPLLVVTQPDRTVGREHSPSPSSVKIAALAHQLPITQPETVTDATFISTLEGLQPDVFVVSAYGAILPAVLLRLPRFGAVNLHASLLPLLRGAAPIHYAILEGYRETGVTLMLMDERMDHGPVLAQRSLSLISTETTASLSAKLATLGAELLRDALPRYLAGHRTPKPQDDRRATFAPLLRKTTGTVDWRQEAARIERMIRALNPWPGVWTTWRGKRLKLLKGSVVPPDGSEPGTVFRHAEETIAVTCGKGALTLDRLQLQSRPAQSSAQFIRGYPAFVGSRLGKDVAPSLSLGNQGTSRA